VDHTIDHGDQPDQVEDLENATQGDEDEDLDLLNEGRLQMQGRGEDIWTSQVEIQDDVDVEDVSTNVNAAVDATDLQRWGPPMDFRLEQVRGPDHQRNVGGPCNGLPNAHADNLDVDPSRWRCVDVNHCRGPMTVGLTSVAPADSSRIHTHPPQSTLILSSPRPGGDEGKDGAPWIDNSLQRRQEQRFYDLPGWAAVGVLIRFLISTPVNGWTMEVRH
jgi:hypothetical protein